MAYEATPTAARTISAVRRRLIRAPSAEPSARGSEALRAAWSVFWTTRAAVLVVAVFAALSFGPAGGGLAERNAEKFDEPELTRSLAEPLLSPLARWDAAWYLRIAESGYGGSGVLPGAFSPYPLLLLAGGAFYAARTGRWAWAGAAAAGAAATRSAGVLLLLPLAMLWWSSRPRKARDAAWLVFALAACVGCFRRLPKAYGAWVAASLVLPLTFPVKPQPLMSLPRFLAVLFPIFMWLAVWSEERRATARVAAVSALGLGLFTAQFASWHWISGDT